MAKARPVAKSGLLGVYPLGGESTRYCARIKREGLAHYLGSFDTKEEAAEAVRRAQVDLPKEPSRGFGEALVAQMMRGQR